VDLIKKKRNFSAIDFFKKYLANRRISLLFLVVLLVIAFVAFSRIENKSLFDSFYWIITTITTVGYGDITPVSFNGKVLSIFVMVLGVATIGFVASEILSTIVSSNLGAILGVNKVRGRVDFLICGWNEVSNATLNELKNQNNKIVILDEERREELTKLDNVSFIKGSPVEKVSLMDANVCDTGTVILTMDNDSEVVLAIHIIRELNPYVNIVAKINNPNHIELAKKSGADHIVGPGAIAGKLLWENHKQPSVAEWIVNNISSDTEYEFYEHDVKGKSKLIGKKIKDIKKKLSGKARIIGVDTSMGLEKIPKDEYIISEGNILLCIVNKSNFGGLE
tara:strand:- start:1212 stop:2219 length:1008 start_codon:yes stop_codon:yes gene_type:complete